MLRSFLRIPIILPSARRRRRRRSLAGCTLSWPWNGPILTDSGGFQVFSLGHLRTLDDDGVTFRSHIDGSTHRFTPESVQELRSSAWRRYCHAAGPVHRASRAACTRGRRPWSAPPVGWIVASPAHAARTRHCSASCKERPSPTFACRHARQVRAFDLPGYAIGGLSVGEPKDGDACHAGAPACRVARRQAAVPHGGRRARRPRRVRGTRRRHVRRRAADTNRAKWHPLDPRWAGSTCEMPNTPRRTDPPTRPVHARPAGRTLSPICTISFAARSCSAYRLATLHNLWFMTSLIARHPRQHSARSVRDISRLEFHAALSTTRQKAADEQRAKREPSTRRAVVVDEKG